MARFTVIDGFKNQTDNSRENRAMERRLALVHQNDDHDALMPPGRAATKDQTQKAGIANLRRAVAKLQAASNEQTAVVKAHRQAVDDLRDAWSDLRATTEKTAENYRSMDLESATLYWKDTARAFGQVK